MTRVLTMAAVASSPAGADSTLVHPLIPSNRHVGPDLLRVSGEPREKPDAQLATSPAELVNQGAELYGVHCITCHGAQLQGTGDGPSLRNAGGASVDFFLETGRMPLPSNAVQAWHVNDQFDPEQTQALRAFVSAKAGTRIPIPDVRTDRSLLQRGRLLFEDNCEACHGAAAQGATAGFGWIAVPLDAATPREIGEAIRIGPGIMPIFPPALISDRDVDAIATYVGYLKTSAPNPGGTPFDYLGPTAEGAIAAAVGIGGLFLVIYFTGTTAQGPRMKRPH
jgi:ubiquinol-cytochrome c reductase cytochrome c subunit